MVINNKQLYKITLTREQLMLISQCVEDISRFAAGDMDLQHTTDTLIDDMDRTESLGIRSFIVNNSRAIRRRLFPDLEDFEHIGYDGGSKDKINMKKIIGIDFDGTCVTDLYPYVGDNIGAASVLRELGDKNLLILYTVRDGKYLQDAVDWFRYNHINLYSVNYNPEPVSSSPKLYCDYYIDDRNIGTPLTDKGYVDWNKMLVLLKQKNLL